MTVHVGFCKAMLTEQFVNFFFLTDYYWNAIWDHVNICLFFLNASSRFVTIMALILLAASRMESKARVATSWLVMSGIVLSKYIEPCFYFHVITYILSKVLFVNSDMLVFNVGLWCIRQSRASSKLHKACKRYVHAWYNCSFWLHAWYF